jgi:hypothetical protein
MHSRFRSGPTRFVAFQDVHFPHSERPAVELLPAQEHDSSQRRSTTPPSAGARVAPRRSLPISRPRSEKPAEHGDVLCVVRRTSRHPFVSEPVKLTKRDLGFWIGMALWIGPPLLPLLVLIVWTIWDVPWQGPPATIAHHATAEAPAKLSERSSNGIGSAHERHSKRNVPSTRRRSSPLLKEISSIQPWQNAK